MRGLAPCRSVRDESALNESADQLKIDPVKLRVLNEPKIDEAKGISFSSRHCSSAWLGAQNSAGRSAPARSAR